MLLAAILIMPLSGLGHAYFGARPVDVFGLFTILAGPENHFMSELTEVVHVVGAWALVALVALHAAGAVKRHVVDRDATLRRMLGRA